MLSREFWINMNKLTDDPVATKRIVEGSLEVWKHVRSVIGSGRYWQITKDEVKALYSLIAAKRPNVVIETGMGPGVSTTAILYAIGRDAKVISIDPGEPYGKGDKEVGFVIPEDLKKNLKYVKGRTSEMLAGVLMQVGKVDVFFHDSDHSYGNVMFELETVLQYLNSQFLIIVDNYDWSDAPADFARTRGLRLQHIADDMALITQ
ncbi:MAG: class I SAM-dependent methyltransferase [Thermoplasmatales archaeon]